MASDDFTDSDGTALSTHDLNWVDVYSPTYEVADYEINSNVCEPISEWVVAGALYIGSSGHTSEIVHVGGATVDEPRRFVVAYGDNGRASADLARGYSAGFEAISGGNFTNIVLRISAGWTAQAAGTWSASSDHTIKIAVSGSSPTNIKVYVDDVEEINHDDSSDTHSTGLSGFYNTSVAGGDVANLRFDSWTDGAGSAPSIIPQASRHSNIILG